MFVCDAQVHAPQPATPAPIPGIDYEPLLAEMAATGVDRVVIVPLGVDSKPSLEMARCSPDKFAVMAVVPLGDERQTVTSLEKLKKTPAVLGVRLSAYAEPTRSMLAEDRLEWLFEAATHLDLPVTMNTMGNPRKLGEIAKRHPDLRFMLDHLGFEPFRTYDDVGPVVDEVVSLAKYPNVAVKATCVPSAVAEKYPFPSLHEPLQRVTKAFGPQRVFWGSDLTRLPCTYLECKRLFTDELRFLSDADKEWIMGRGICEWLRWPLPWDSTPGQLDRFGSSPRTLFHK
jgi:L-fuconolactonase